MRGRFIASSFRSARRLCTWLPDRLLVLCLLMWRDTHQSLAAARLAEELGELPGPQAIPKHAVHPAAVSSG